MSGNKKADNIPVRPKVSTNVGAGKSPASPTVTTGSPTKARGAKAPISVKLTFLYHSGPDFKYGATFGPKIKMADATALSAENTEGTWLADTIQAGFTVPVKVGENKATKNFLVDTGSPLTWRRDSNENLDYHDTSHTMTITYLDGSQFRGRRDDATLTIGPDPASSVTIPNQYMAIGHLYRRTKASRNKMIPSTQVKDGIMGISPQQDTENIVKQLSAPNKNGVRSIQSRKSITDTVQSVFVGLRSVGLPAVIGQFYTPYEHRDAALITYGGFDAGKCTSPPVFTKRINHGTNHWQFKQKLSFGDPRTELTSLNGMMDSGASMLTIPGKVFDIYVKRIGAVYDASIDAFVLDQDKFNALPNMYFTIEGKEFEYPPDAQVWPKALSKKENVADGKYVLAITPGADKENTVMYGLPVLQRFYLVLDDDKGQIGFAETQFTHDTSNAGHDGPPGSRRGSGSPVDPSDPKGKKPAKR